MLYKIIVQKLIFTLLFQVAAKIIDQPDKAQWKNCVVSEAEEAVMTDKFKADFEKYDFTLL